MKTDKKYGTVGRNAKLTLKRNQLLQQAKADKKKKNAHVSGNKDEEKKYDRAMSSHHLQFQRQSENQSTDN